MNLITAQNFALFVIILTFTARVHCLQASVGSCKEARLCCPGRDPSCVVNWKSRFSRHSPFDGKDDLINDISSRSCYCDAACTSVGDCCPDYEQTCGVSDCEVDEWGPWSSCSSECGPGTQTRERKVLTPVRNGGRPCPELIQKRRCHGVNCEVSRSAIKASKEAALILPASYSTVRRSLNDSLDIRSNLRVRYPKDPAKEQSRDYCVIFEVVKTRKGCEQSDTPANQLLAPGNKVCVSCATAAMRKHLGYRCHGHGVDDQPTRYASVYTDNCYGRWIRRGKVDGSGRCPCHEDGSPDFIFI